MVFDWFRRKFDRDDSSAPSEPEVTPTDEVVAEEVVAEPAAATEVAAADDATTDYLAWAKAAYQNIQQQQSEGEFNSTNLEVESTDIDDLADDAEPPQVETTVDDTEDREELDEESLTSFDTSSMPAWAKEDRQERIERLKATAIETVEPAPVADKIELDDDFMWSAKILADRGRTPEQISLDEINWLKKLRQGLDKTRLSFVNQLKSLLGQGPLDRDAVETIETLLLQADVGIEATDYTIAKLQDKLKSETLPPEQAIAYLKQILCDLLDAPYQQDYQPDFMPVKDTLNIWLLTGVNGVGKTTTIGKLARMSKDSGYSCLIAAADTFRAAAVEQVKVWGERSGIDVIANPGKNTDPAAVVYDGISAAQARGTELLLVDTAGRLQNKKNLMDELSKIRRIIDKQAPHAQIESLLVLDATLGQNGLRQAQVFAEAAKLSGVVLTKLDGTAKGGVALAVVQQLGLPIRFIGAGEGIDDLRPFSSYEFVEALLNG
jgi:fused signal recognition particle receptor